MDLFVPFVFLVFSSDNCLAYVSPKPDVNRPSLSLCPSYRT